MRRQPPRPYYLYLRHPVGTDDLINVASTKWRQDATAYVGLFSWNPSLGACEVRTISEYIPV